ncbi:N-6 DNA methylase [Bradyrhizobium sp. Pear76]|uniref:N-6 DNA methylase n=1 Tax=Bradyrhizobium oropedii TaxID=1571201 RepID=UPI001E640B5F|nr:N-6 DNA methylase [Bradyrhizobium oropedii]MCC8963742.1 N-6 DNA methylase [Bradyrhizobium oropedii]
MSVKRSAVLLNTDAHRPARDQLIDHLNQVTRREGWRDHEAISYWLDATFRSMRGATLVHRQEEHDKNEAEYMRIVKRCRHPIETMTDLSHMFGALVLALEAEPVDFIGPIFGELASSAQLGQFFTPYHASKMMAAMIIEEPMDAFQRSGQSYITFQEPACGVGGMALAACEVLREYQFDLARQVHWTLVDIDYQAHCAAYLQMNLCHISADVIHGNTLSLETWISTPTLAAILHPKRPKAGTQADPPSAAPETPAIEQAAPRPTNPVQLPLFEGLT